MRFILSLLKDSLVLDFKTLGIKEWSLKNKFVFILKKNFLVIKHFIKKFNLGKDYINFNHRKIFYNSKYGLAGYQAIYCRERRLLRDIAKINKAKTVLDVGANVGYFSMLCRELYPKSKIYAFEPIPKTFDCLKKNFEKDMNTEVFNLAVGNKEGVLKMSFNEENSAVSTVDDKGDIKVKSVTLDSFCKERNIDSIDILKIDTETFESYVLSGARSILKGVKYILMEVTIENNKNYTISSLFKLLSTSDYNFQILGFRNFSNKGDGRIDVMDVILENVQDLLDNA